jgi:hypothetical protein
MGAQRPTARGGRSGGTHCYAEPLFPSLEFNKPNTPTSRDSRFVCAVCEPSSKRTSIPGVTILVIPIPRFRDLACPCKDSSTWSVGPGNLALIDSGRRRWRPRGGCRARVTRGSPAVRPKSRKQGRIFRCGLQQRDDVIEPAKLIFNSITSSITGRRSP